MAQLHKAAEHHLTRPLPTRAGLFFFFLGSRRNYLGNKKTSTLAANRIRMPIVHALRHETLQIVH